VRVELFHGGKSLDKLEKKPRLVGQLAKREGSTVHRGLDDTQCVWSQQLGL